MEVRAEGVSKIYDGRPVLAGVDLHLPAGQCLLVCGPNGSGKSTLLRVLATLTPPSTGRVHYDGRPGDEWGPELRARMGVLLHESLLYDELTAGENLEWTARLYGIRRPGPVVEAALEDVGLRAFRHEPVGRFSRGMKQRLSLARSLLADPDFILWDEPYEGLDRRALDRLEDKLLRLRERGKTMVIVAHHWERVWPHADRVAYMRAGRVRLEGAREAIDPGQWQQLFREDSLGAGRATERGAR